MQKTEVFDIINIFMGPFWPFLSLRSGVNFFGLIFGQKND
jgi:hypothetical protein